MSDDLIAQIIGLIASALVITAFAQKSDRRFKLCIAAGTFTFALHFFLLAAYAGAIITFLNSVRTLVSMKFHGSNYILIGFLCLYVVAGIIVYERPLDLLPIFSGAIATFAFYKLSGIKLRIMFLFTEAGWTIYSIVIKSLGGLVTNTFILGTNATTIYRLMRDKKREAPK